ncbi:uncharacterized protein [Rutidosis leptorrhynchoides]|uniref:uncharacterized protein n=1 Tax=Rutidosis leptorrhynchoides TaxID=125765 RepID=UPI003A9A5B03
MNLVHWLNVFVFNRGVSGSSPGYDVLLFGMASKKTPPLETNWIQFYDPNGTIFAGIEAFTRRWEFTAGILFCQPIVPEKCFPADASRRDGYLRSCPSSFAAGRSRGFRRGDRLANRVRIRVGSWNVGSLTSKSRELVDTLIKRKVDILCVQETRWRGEEAVCIDDYKLWFSGFSVARNGVGIIIGRPYRDHVVGVDRFSDRIMSVRLVVQEETFMVISAYAPHAGLGEDEKRRFWESLDAVVRRCPADHRFLIGGDLNGHIGTDVEGYDGVHGGFGFGVRNEEGRSILEFAVAHDLVVANSFFKKTEAQLATFHSGGNSTQIDYLLLRKGDLRSCGDCRALTTWVCSTQHRLLVMDLVLQRRVFKSARPAQPRILWKNLNEEKAETFKALVLERVEAGVEMDTHVNADQMWESLASTIREAAKESLGVAVGTSKGHRPSRESWWISDEVQTKVALKQLRFRELTACREGTTEDRTMAEERYKEAKIEAKKVVARAKDKAYEDLYKKLDSKEGANDIYRIAKAREYRRRDIDNIKGIKLLSHTIKLWERVIETRLRRETTISENQFGFMPGRSSMEAIHIIRSLIEKFREKQKSLEMVFLDLEKAYDCVSRKLIWKTLNVRGIPSRYIRAITDMYEGAKSCVRTPVGNTEYFPIDVGLHQGSALSPFLFALILDELSRGLQESVLWCLIFADDIVLVSESKEDLNRRLEQWRETLEQNGIRISRQKTEYLRCDFAKTEDEQNVGVHINIGDQILHPQDSFRYLGSVLHKSGRIDEDVTHHIKAG